MRARREATNLLLRGWQRKLPEEEFEAEMAPTGKFKCRKGSRKTTFVAKAGLNDLHILSGPEEPHLGPVHSLAR